MGALADLVREGKIGPIGFCEVSAGTLRRTLAVHPVAAVQTEYALWTRDAEHSVLAACRELNIGFVAYAPLGRGFLTGSIDDRNALAADDVRRALPRFAEDHMEENAAAAAIVLTATEVAELHAAAAAHPVSGERYTEEGMRGSTPEPPRPSARRAARLHPDAGPAVVAALTEPPHLLTGV